VEGMAGLIRKTKATCASRFFPVACPEPEPFHRFDGEGCGGGGELRPESLDQRFDGVGIKRQVGAIPPAHLAKFPERPCSSRGFE
jgi:hypothetical protein